jgi:transposase
MARRSCISDDMIHQAKQLRDHATTIADYRKGLSVLLAVQFGLDAEQTAEVLGTSRRTIFRDRKNICSQDVAKPNSWGGRRRSSMTIEQEQSFLAEWESKATDGHILTVPPIHAALIERLGHELPLSTTYRLLARHGWRKVQPDTKHPKSNPAAQDEFKKNFQRQWLPPA